MGITNKKTYLIDNDPVTPVELINRAKEIDNDFRSSFFRATSEAAYILRENGHIVTVNPDIQS